MTAPTDPQNITCKNKFYNNNGCSRILKDFRSDVKNNLQVYCNPRGIINLLIGERYMDFTKMTVKERANTARIYTIMK
jgi:hypothetical protein